MDLLKRNEKSEKSKLKKRSTNVLEWRHRKTPTSFLSTYLAPVALPPRPPSLLPCALPFDIVPRTAHGPAAAPMHHWPHVCSPGRARAPLAAHLPACVRTPRDCCCDNTRWRRSTQAVRPTKRWQYAPMDKMS